MKASPVFEPSHFSAKTAERQCDQHTEDECWHRRWLLDSAMCGLKTQVSNAVVVRGEREKKKKVGMKGQRGGEVK